VTDQGEERVRVKPALWYDAVLAGRL